MDRLTKLWGERVDVCGRVWTRVDMWTCRPRRVAQILRRRVELPAHSLDTLHEIPFQLAQALLHKGLPFGDALGGFGVVAALASRLVNLNLAPGETSLAPLVCAHIRSRLNNMCSGAG